MERCKYLSNELNNVLEQSEKTPWIFMRDTKEGDVITIQTLKSLYVIKVVDPWKRDCMISSNSKSIPFDGKRKGSVIGTTLTGTGTMVKVGGIATGFRLCLWIKDIGEIYTSVVQKVFINGVEQFI